MKIALISENFRVDSEFPSFNSGKCYNFDPGDCLDSSDFLPSSYFEGIIDQFVPKVSK